MMMEEASDAQRSQTDAADPLAGLTAAVAAARIHGATK